MFKLFKKNKKDTGIVGATLGLDNPISDYMKDMLAKSGYSQSEVANIMCVTQTSVSRWLSGDRIPKVTDFLKFCEVCGHGVLVFDRYS